MTAWAALIIWPIVSFVFYNKLTAPVALCATIVGGYLLLPTRFGLDLPILPPLDKRTIPTIVAFIFTAVAIRKDAGNIQVLPGWIPRDPVVLGLLMLLVVGTLGSVFTNREALVFGPRVLQGHSLYDAGSMLLEIGMVIAPLFLARRLLSFPDGQRILLTAIVVSAVAYSFLALYEIRMSPQLNMMIYGFFPHQFAQHMRGGGFRPVVFFGHGLGLSLFLTFATLAAAGLFRSAKEGDRMKWGLAMAWLFAVMVLSKSLGALMIAVVLLPCLLFLKTRMQLLVATCIAGMVLTYPALRAADQVPVDRIMAFAEQINPNRAASFMTRLENEELLLERAREKPVFGWGGWGRQRIFDEFGNNLSVTDGSWVIELGAGGWFRYIGLFGLLCWPVIGLFLGPREKIDPICAALALLLCAKLVDLIPNSGIPPISWLMVGALIGRLEMKRGAVTGQQIVEKPVVEPGYARKPGSADEGRPATDLRYARDFSQKKDEAERPTGRKAEPKARRSIFYKRPKTSPGYRR
ncbi:hypothetical protein ACOTTU_21780 [Roseobacter sp. EG26]|uniref:hypothetical protein n=1 Tax=Roseobacter sp. EG26 TaxID=3412477 RepID=UPI003CE48705